MRFPTLIVLILRSNKFDGELPQELCHLKDLQILDLANNTFVGIIPRCIGNFSAMVKVKKKVKYDLNLQYSAYMGALRESAMVTTKGNMYHSNGNIPNHKYEDNESDKDEVDWFYISMAIGFALSFWGVRGLLLFKRSWRHAYFRFLDRSWEMLFAKLPVC
ncbi:hypothetical protein KY285_001747 [Solanum tuberosum]|nr:hypothetical protein KY285_001747 [Solanum tuberosum]